MKNIPDQREDINSQLTLEQRKKGLKLSPAEEKTIIESLTSQVNIDKEKSFFDPRWGFNMVPGGVWEIRKDMDKGHYLFTDQGKFFVKINPFSDLSRFEHEKESMEAINEAVPDLAPQPFCLGNLPKGGKFLVMNFLESRWDDYTTITAQKSLAKKLAWLHQKIVYCKVKEFRRKLLFKMKKLAQKLKTQSIHIEIEKFLKHKYKKNKNGKRNAWAYFKTQPFNYNTKFIDQIKIEIENIDGEQELFEEEGEYTIEAEEVFVKNNSLKIPLLWQSELIEGKLEKLVRIRRSKSK